MQGFLISHQQCSSSSHGLINTHGRQRKRANIKHWGRPDCILCWQLIVSDVPVQANCLFSWYWARLKRLASFSLHPLFRYLYVLIRFLAPAFLSSRHNSCYSLSLSSQERHFSPLIIWALCRALSSMYNFLLYRGAQDWMQYFRCSLTNSDKRKIRWSFLTCWQKLCLMQPRITLTFLMARAHCWLIYNLVPIKTPGPFLQSCFLAGCTGAQGCSFPSTGLHTAPAEHHEIQASPHLQPAEVPLDGCVALWWISQPHHCCVTVHLLVAVYPTIQSITM